MRAELASGATSLPKQRCLLARATKLAERSADQVGGR
jgi:hypothetical protein